MASPRIDELLDQVGSRYALVMAASRRARQLNSYRHQADVGFDTAVPPLVDEEQNDLSTAFQEIAEGKIVVSEGSGPARPEPEAAQAQGLDFGFDLEE